MRTPGITAPRWQGTNASSAKPTLQLYESIHKRHFGALRGTAGNDAVHAAREFGQTVSLSAALIGTSVVAAILGDSAATRARSEELTNLAKQEGFVLDLSWANINHGYALALEGDCGAGIAQMLEGLAAVRAARTRASLPQCHCWLAESYAKSGQPEKARTALADAFAAMENTGERMYESELHRVSGVIALISNPPDSSEAERSFRIAIATARRLRQREQLSCVQVDNRARRGERQRFRELGQTSSCPRFGRSNSSRKSAEVRAARPASPDRSDKLGRWSEHFRPRTSPAQILKQRLGVFQVLRIEAFGEPAVDLGERCARLIAVSLRREQPREAGNPSGWRGSRARSRGEFCPPRRGPRTPRFRRARRARRDSRSATSNSSRKSANEVRFSAAGCASAGYCVATPPSRSSLLRSISRSCWMLIAPHPS